MLRFFATILGSLWILNTVQGEERHVGESAGPVGAGATSELPALTVTASPVSSYSAVNASTATKTDTPIMETPVSIQVVPAQVLQEQQSIDVQDAVKNVSGVVPQFNFGYREGFLLRGFPTRDTQRQMVFSPGIRASLWPMCNGWRC